MFTGASFEGAGRPSPPGKRKKRKEKKRKKRRKKERNEGTMNNVKLLHIKCCFFQFFNSPVALKNKKNSPPRKSWNDAPACSCWILLLNQTYKSFKWNSIRIIIHLCFWFRLHFRVENYFSDIFAVMHFLHSFRNLNFKCKKKIVIRAWNIVWDLAEISKVWWIVFMQASRCYSYTQMRN